MTTEAKRVYLQNENDEILLPYSAQALEDGDGNVISETYLKKTDYEVGAKQDLSNVSPVQDFKTSSISWGMPDYSAGVDYANNTTVNTAPSNGVLVISYYVSAVTTGYFKINGQNIASSYHNAAYATTVTGQYMLSKGDTFQITSVAMASTSAPFIYRFYPCKGAN